MFLFWYLPSITKVAEYNLNPAKRRNTLRNWYLCTDHIIKKLDEDRKKADELQIVLNFDQKKQKEEKSE